MARRQQWLLRASRGLPHQAGITSFSLEDQRAGRVDHQFQKGDVQRRQHQRQAQQHGQHRQTDDRHVHSKRVAHGLPKVCKRAAATVDGMNDGREVVLKQHKCCSFARHVGAVLAHRDADVRCLQRRRIVDAVARHGYHFAAVLQGLHQGQLLLWPHARENIDRRQSMRQRGGVHFGQFVTGNDLAAADACLCCDGARCAGMIASNHDHADTGLLALRNRLWDLVAQRVGQPDQADPFEREVVLGRRPVLVAAVSCFRHPQHPQATVGHAGGFCAHLVAPRIVQVTQVGYRFGGALGGHHIVRHRITAPQMAHGQQLRR